MIGCLGSILGFLGWIGICAIIGAIVKAVTHIEIMFWVVSIGLFVLSIPGMLINLFFDGISDIIHEENEYAQDRADYRELMRDISEDIRHEEYLDKIESKHSKSDIYIDNRQIHFHNHESVKKSKRIKK